VNRMANPLPLGFLALGGATLLVSGLQLGWLGPDQGHTVAWMILGFTVPVQLVASVFGLREGDPVAGTGMGLLAASWAAIAVATLQGAPGTTSDALGLLLVFSALAMLVPATAAGLTPGKALPAAVMATTAVRFLLTALFELTAIDAWAQLAALAGLVLCALAVVVAAALLVGPALRSA